MQKQKIVTVLCFVSALTTLSCSNGESRTQQTIQESAPTFAATVVTERPSETPEFIQKAEVVSEIGNLRDNNSSTARILKVLPQYTWVEVIKTEKKWLYVKTLRGELGWLVRDSTRMLQPLPPASAYANSGRYDSPTDYSSTSSRDIPGGKELYQEVQRLKSQDGLTDREAVRKILREMGEIE